MLGIKAKICSLFANKFYLYNCINLNLVMIRLLINAHFVTLKCYMKLSSYDSIKIHLRAFYIINETFLQTCYANRQYFSIVWTKLCRYLIFSFNRALDYLHEDVHGRSTNPMFVFCILFH